MRPYSSALRVVASIVAGLGLSGTLSQAYAEPLPEHKVVNLSAESSREVKNDQMQATLFTEKNNTNAGELAKDVAQIINHAMEVARHYPSVQVTTGSQNAYPIYDAKQKLTGWRSRAEVQLKSTDFKATSELMSQLQPNLLIESVNFTVSPEQRIAVENELLTNVTQAFKQRAVILQNAWNASGYELITMSVNPSENRPVPYPKMYAMRASSAMADASVPPQNVEGGNSSVHVSANGSIQLR